MSGSARGDSKRPRPEIKYSDGSSGSPADGSSGSAGAAATASDTTQPLQAASSGQPTASDSKLELISLKEIVARHKLDVAAVQALIPDKFLRGTFGIMAKQDMIDSKGMT
jgi:hypothetical protein